MMGLLRIIFFLLLLIAAPPLCAQTTDWIRAYEPHQFSFLGRTMPYRLLLPPGYDGKKKFPILLFLHGAGERGHDNVAQLKHGAALFAQPATQAAYPAIIVFPQCAAGDYWSNVNFIPGAPSYRRLQFRDGGPPTPSMQLAEALFDSLTQALAVEVNRMYVGGLSMGGMGTYELVGRHPGWFSAAFAICGGADTASAVRLTLPQWYIFHGLADEVVPAFLSEQMVRSLERTGTRVKYKFYPGIKHDSWTTALAEPDFLPWLFSATKTGF